MLLWRSHELGYPIAGIGMIMNIASPHDWLGDNDWSTRVSYSCDCVTLTEAPSNLIYQMVYLIVIRSKL